MIQVKEAGRGRAVDVNDLGRVLSMERHVGNKEHRLRWGQKAIRITEPGAQCISLILSSVRQSQIYASSARRLHELRLRAGIGGRVCDYPFIADREVH